MQTRYCTGGAPFAFLRRHVALFVLLAVLAALSFKTVDTYLLSDDLKWVERTVADAKQPWRAFGAPLFGSYFRPMPHLAWLINYYLWGFDFAAHHAMFLGMWLAIVALVYAVGQRLGGRVAGITAACLVGFNDIYLVIASWKSWYTTLVEMFAVLAWAWFYLGWLERRRRRDLVLWIVFAVIGLLSRELAPLIVSASVLVTLVLPAFRRKPEGEEAASDRAAGPDLRRGAMALLIWLVVTCAALAVLPSYRNAALGLFAHGEQAVATTAGKPADVSPAYFPNRLRSHVHSMFAFGLSRYLLFFAVAHAAFRAFGWRKRLGQNYGAVMLAVLGAGVLVLGLRVNAAGVLGGDLFSIVADEGGYWLVLGLLCVSVAVGLMGKARDRMLAAWFAVAFLPIMVLLHSSNAYHMLAFTAMALFIARALAALVRDDIVPFAQRLRAGTARSSGRDDGSVPTLRATGCIAAALAIGFAVGQAWMLYRNVRLVRPAVSRRVAFGSEKLGQVKTAVRGILRDSGETRVAWLGEDAYGRIAGLMLQEEHGFTIKDIRAGERPLVGLRTFDSPLPVYSEAIPYSDALFRRHNAFPNPSFEDAAPGMPLSSVARTGKRSIALGEPSQPGGLPPVRSGKRTIDSSPFSLRPDVGYVFGGFLRTPRAPLPSRVRMEIRSAEGRDYVIGTPAAGGPPGEWELVWECLSPPEGTGRLVFSAISVEQNGLGAFHADDIFLCPVRPLMDEARKGRE